MKSQRFFSLWLVLTMLLGLLTGCGGTQGAPDASNTEDTLTASNEVILAEAELRKDTFYRLFVYSCGSKMASSLTAARA